MVPGLGREAGILYIIPSRYRQTHKQPANMSAQEEMKIPYQGWCRKGDMQLPHTPQAWIRHGVSTLRRCNMAPGLRHAQELPLCQPPERPSVIPTVRLVHRDRLEQGLRREQEFPTHERMAPRNRCRSSPIFTNSGCVGSDAGWHGH
jgi:hypothetical protein